MIRLLMAMRTQLDAIQIQLDHLIEQEQQRGLASVPFSCSHTEKIDLSSMGHQGRWQCKTCRYEHDPGQPHDGATLEGGLHHG
jgi:hypothetical protein